MRAGFSERYLVETNVRWLRQTIELLEELDDESYVTKPSLSGGQSLGPQIRHIIEFYECFLNGLLQRHIDYGARKRDGAIEASRLAALDRLRVVRSHLLVEAVQLGDCTVWVRVEDSAAETYVMSSVGRELQELSSHTVHHLALIAMIARAIGIDVDPELGVSPSTLAHRRLQFSSAQPVLSLCAQ